MKSRRNFRYLIFLFISVLFISIGYASINGLKLQISGGAYAKPAEVESLVEFSSLSTDIQTSSSCLSDTGTISNCATIEANVTNSRTANFNISGLKGYGDIAIVNYKIINESDKRVLLNISSTVNTNSEYFTITSELSNGISEILNAGESTILTIKAKVNKILYTGDLSDTDVTVTISPSVIE